MNDLIPLVPPGAQALDAISDVAQHQSLIMSLEEIHSADYAEKLRRALKEAFTAKSTCNERLKEVWKCLEDERARVLDLFREKEQEDFYYKMKALDPTVKKIDLFEEKDSDICRYDIDEDKVTLLFWTSVSVCRDTIQIHVEISDASNEPKTASLAAKEKEAKDLEDRVFKINCHISELRKQENDAPHIRAQTRAGILRKVIGKVNPKVLEELDEFQATQTIAPLPGEVS